MTNAQIVAWVTALWLALPCTLLVILWARHAIRVASRQRRADREFVRQIAAAEFAGRLLLDRERQRGIRHPLPSDREAGR